MEESDGMEIIVPHIKSTLFIYICDKSNIEKEKSKRQEMGVGGGVVFAGWGGCVFGGGSLSS